MFLLRLFSRLFACVRVCGEAKKNFFWSQMQEKRLHVRESNPGRLRDRQKCYQLHQRGQASNEIRTRDLSLTKRMLCQLSYRGTSNDLNSHPHRRIQTCSNANEKNINRITLSSIINVGTGGSSAVEQRTVKRLKCSNPLVGSSNLPPRTFFSAVILIFLQRGAHCCATNQHVSRLQSSVGRASGC